MRALRKITGGSFFFCSAMVLGLPLNTAMADEIVGETLVAEFGAQATEVAGLGARFHRTDDGKAVVAIAPGRPIDSSASYDPRAFADSHQLLTTMYGISSAERAVVGSSIKAREIYLPFEHKPGGIPGSIDPTTAEIWKIIEKCLKNPAAPGCGPQDDPCRELGRKWCDPYFLEEGTSVKPWVSLYRGASLPAPPMIEYTPAPDDGGSYPWQEFVAFEKSEVSFGLYASTLCGRAYDLTSSDPMTVASFHELQAIHGLLCARGFSMDFMALLNQWDEVVRQVEETPVMSMVQVFSFRPAMPLALSLVPLQSQFAVDWGRIDSLKDLNFLSPSGGFAQEELIGFFSPPGADVDPQGNSVAVRTNLSLIGMMNFLESDLPARIMIPGSFYGRFSNRYGEVQVESMDVALCFILVGADWNSLQAYSCQEE